MKTQAMNEMLDVAPERHVHIKGNTIYTTVHPAGTADTLRRDYMVARRALDLYEREMRFMGRALSVDQMLDVARQATLH